MQVTRMKTGEWGKLRAFFDIEVDGFIIKGFKIVEGSNGLFVSMPSQKNEEGDYNDTVWVDKDTRPSLNDMAISFYNNEKHPMPKKSGGMSEVAYEESKSGSSDDGYNIKKEMDNNIPF
tara:strand:+ start:3344 stop:3700 length:357 start_codon:yes stop_codon:yes gene_type:complete